MQRGISIPVFSPLISSPRLAGERPSVRLKLPSIAWAVALIAVGIGPASVIAEANSHHEHHAAQRLRHPRDRRRQKVPQQGRTDLLALHREYQAYLEQRSPRRVGRPGSNRVTFWRRSPQGT